MTLKDGWVVGAEHRPTHSRYSSIVYPTWCGIDGPLAFSADAIVLHFTVSYFATAVETLSTSAGKSAHFLVGRGGQIVQMVPLDVGAWHVRDSAEFEGSRCWNQRSIGIEMENCGPVIEHETGFSVWNSGQPWPVDPGDVQRFPGELAHVETSSGEVATEHWHLYAAEQLAAVTELCVLMRAELGVDRLLRHSEIQDGKVDPGPAIDAGCMQRSIRGEK